MCFELLGLLERVAPEDAVYLLGVCSRMAMHMVLAPVEMERKEIYLEAETVNNDLSKRDSIPLCKFLEPGHLDSFNFGSLEFALNFLDEIGLENVQAQLQKLSNRAMTAFSDLGLLQPFVSQRKQHSTIFNIKDDKKLFDKLTEENVVVSPRGGGVRLSFHFYNTEEEVDVIATLLKRWMSK